MSPVSITLGDLSAAALEERRYPVSLFSFLRAGCAKSIARRPIWSRRRLSAWALRRALTLSIRPQNAASIRALRPSLLMAFASAKVRLAYIEKRDETAELQSGYELQADAMLLSPTALLFPFLEGASKSMMSSTKANASHPSFTATKITEKE